MTRSRFLFIGVFAILAAVAPLLGADRQNAAAQAALLLVAAIALGVAVGRAGQPSLGQGAFVGAGAYAAALSRRAGIDPITAIVIGTAIATLSGAVVAAGVSRLRPAFVAVVTWLVAWSFSIALRSFSVFGGDAGLVVPPVRLRLRALGVNASAGGIWLLEASILLLALTFVAVHVVVRRFGPALGLARADPAAARAAGIDVARLRRAALVGSALAGGLAGAMLVQVIGVADPTFYGPLLSVKLFVVVLLGGAESTLGPAVGLVALYGISKATGGLASAAGITASRIEPLVAGVALLVVISTGGGLMSLFRRRPSPTPDVRTTPMRFQGATLDARGLRVVFGGLVALDGVDVRVEPGAVHAIIGPNGSGKTTALRALAGATAPDEGEVWLGDQSCAAMGMGERVAAGLARTLQRSSVPAGLTVREHVAAGLEVRRDRAWWRAVLRTPRARDEDDEAERAISQTLGFMALAPLANTPVEQLTGYQQRLTQIARAIASRPRVLLLDEPAAGLGHSEEQQLREVLMRLRDAGLTVVLVEHNVRLVRALASQVTVLDAGRVIALGSPDEVAADAAVLSAYLGTDRMPPREAAAESRAGAGSGVLQLARREAGGTDRGDRPRRAAGKGGTHRATDRTRRDAGGGFAQQSRRRSSGSRARPARAQGVRQRRVARPVARQRARGGSTKSGRRHR